MNNDISRATGLLIIEVRNSNPNGDPDRDSDPRTRSHDGRGVISDVSYKRKLRDLVWNGMDFQDWPLSTPMPPAGLLEAYTRGQSPVWEEVSAVMGALDPLAHQIYVCRGRTYKEPSSDTEFAEFTRRFWDCRLFGNTVIERAKIAPAEDASVDDDVAATSKPAKGKKAKDNSELPKAGAGRFIRTGAVTFGIAVSAAKVRIQRDTNTVKAGVQEGKDRGMAPLGFRVVEHGVYAMPFTVNPTSARNSGCTASDVELMCRLIPHAYAHNASRIRPLVEVRHAWYFEHASTLGSCSDFALFDVLTPSKERPSEPSTAWDEYGYDAAKLEELVKTRHAGAFAHFGDLCRPGFTDQVFARRT